MNIETTGILRIAYPEVESKLSNSGNLNKYKRFMAEFISKRQKQLYANIPNQMILYSYDDINKWFAASGVDKTVIKVAIKDTYYAKVPAFNPSYAKDESTIALLCMVRYFHLHKMEKELNLALLNMAFSGKFYPSIFYRSFKYEPADYVMDYVVNHMLSNKYDIIRYGNVIGAVKSSVETWYNTYKDRFASFNDNDVCYLLQQLHNRIGSFIINIAELYYEAYENKDSYITYDSDNVSEDDYHLADNDSFKINRIVDNTMTELCSKNIDFINCRRAANSMVRFEELKSILDCLLGKNENLPLIREYVTLMVSTYFQQAKFKDVKDIAFISYSIKAQPNSRDKYILRKRELIDQILINNAEDFQRRRNRAATESSYYRAFNAYMALMIKKANS